MNEQLFRSLRNVFAGRPEAGFQLAVLVAILIAIGAIVHLVGVRRRLRIQRRELDAFLATLAATTVDAATLRRVARAAGVDALAIATRIDVFEAATAKLLCMVSFADELFGRVRELRVRLGFDALPLHFPLLTSRELVAGQRVTVGPHSGFVSLLSESLFVVELSEYYEPAPGQNIIVKLQLDDGQRYELPCALLTVDERRGGSSLNLQHCESPARVQQREYVRVLTEGACIITSLAGETHLEHPESRIIAEIVDISVGGMRTWSECEFSTGVGVRLAFDLRQGVHVPLEKQPALPSIDEFKDIGAVVVGCSKDAQNGFALQLEFVGIKPADRAMLSRWVSYETSHARPGQIEKKRARSPAQPDG